MSQSGEISGSPAVRYLPLPGIESQLGFLLGEILTLADASFADKQQCKAFKDLTRQFFHGRIRWIDQICTTSDLPASQNYSSNCTQSIYTIGEEQC